MAERRMFTKKVTDDDNFMSLSSSAQALYLHLSMSADDDGFCNQINIAMFKAHASIQDLEALLSKRYIYQFENGVIVIKHWRMANALRKDRYTPTAFQEELKQLKLKNNGAYTWSGCQVVAEGLPSGCQVEDTGKDRLDKDSIDKDRLDISAEPTKVDSTPKKEIKYADVPLIPLNDGTEWSMPLELYDEYVMAYPALDIKQEVSQMRIWSLSNPSNRKTRRGMTRFVNGWLERSQNNSRKRKNTGSSLDNIII